MTTTTRPRTQRLARLIRRPTSRQWDHAPYGALTTYTNVCIHHDDHAWPDVTSCVVNHPHPDDDDDGEGVIYILAAAVAAVGIDGVTRPWPAELNDDDDHPPTRRGKARENPTPP